MKKSTVIILLGLVLILAALCLTGYNVLDSRRADAAAQEVLEQILPQIAPAPAPEAERGKTESDIPRPEEIEYPDYVLNPNMPMPVETVDGNDYVGVLSLPTLDLELPVFDKWDYNKLTVSPCRYSGSAYLHNMVICAHNYRRHFGAIGSLAYGDAVSFTDMAGNVFRYEVMEIETLRPTAIEEMTSGDWDLTLFTCTKGGATRITVRCRAIQIPLL